MNFIFVCGSIHKLLFCLFWDTELVLFYIQHIYTSKICKKYHSITIEHIHNQRKHGMPQNKQFNNNIRSKTIAFFTIATVV